MKMSILEEIKKRKTFAIISHPDAGKTTLTEKLLLFVDAIQMAGAVKSSKIKKATVSDFMEIERQRGISVTSAVMSFEYAGMKINLLDTPGHKDFAEDTYRTLTAVDSVILVVDSVKGVEEQTEKLMNVCRMRSTPVMIFVNKLDREGRNPIELLDELENKLDIKAAPMSWPISRGSSFKGVYHLYKKNLNIFRPHGKADGEETIRVNDLFSAVIDEYTGPELAARLREDVALVEGVYEPFNMDLYLSGKQAPVFFGSALNNFGVKELLETFVELAPGPGPMEADTRMVNPEENTFSGFVFKIHANIDPNHRDRIAFLRICSGKFERNKFYYHVRLDTEVSFSKPASFLGQKKNFIDEAYPGDVIGLYDRDKFKIGDTLTEGEKLMFKGIPKFSPEIFKELVHTSLKAKQLEKGIRQLTEEGVAQLFIMKHGNKKVVGTVGQLQFDVILYRLKNEYGAECRFEPMYAKKACWFTSDDKKQMEEFQKYKADSIGYDSADNPVFFAGSQWDLDYYIKTYPNIKFYFTSEFKAG